MDEGQFQRICKALADPLCKALADPRRLEVLECIAAV
jgi:hypothetical protein